MKIKFLSSVLPKNRINVLDYNTSFSNFELAHKRSGVNQKYIVDKDQTALDLAYEAFLKIDNLSLVSDLQLIVFVTQTPDYLLPGNSFLLMGKLGLSEEIINFDINQACTGFIYGTLLIEKFMENGNINSAALICSDTYSKILDKEDRGTSMLFGDAASVTIFNSSEGIYSVLKSKVKNFSSYNDLFIVRSALSRDNFKSKKPLIEMKGASLLNLITLVAPNFIKEFLSSCNLKLDSIDMFIFHQASKVAIETLQSLLNISEDKVFKNISDKGNTACATIPIAIEDMTKKYSSKLPNYVLIFGFGVGFSIGCTLLKINK